MPPLTKALTLSSGKGWKNLKPLLKIGGKENLQPIRKLTINSLKPLMKKMAPSEGDMKGLPAASIC